MTREQLRQRIDAMECLHDLLTAIDDMESAEFKAGETIDLTLSDRSEQKAPIAFVHSLPPAMATAVLLAMAKAVEEQLAREAIPA